MVDRSKSSNRPTEEPVGREVRNDPIVYPSVSVKLLCAVAISVGTRCDRRTGDVDRRIPCRRVPVAEPSLVPTPALDRAAVVMRKCVRGARHRPASRLCLDPKRRRVSPDVAEPSPTCPRNSTPNTSARRSTSRARVVAAALMRLRFHQAPAHRLYRRVAVSPFRACRRRCYPNTSPCSSPSLRNCGVASRDRRHAGENPTTFVGRSAHSGAITTAPNTSRPHLRLHSSSTRRVRAADIYRRYPCAQPDTLTESGDSSSSRRRFLPHRCHPSISMRRRSSAHRHAAATR